MTSSVPIVQTGAAILRTKADPVPLEQIATADFQQLVALMIRTMREAPGVGLAAPQIGVPLRVLVLEDRDAFLSSLSEAELTERERVPVPVRVFINPSLEVIGTETVSFFEGCLSVEGFTALVTRWREVEITGLDEKGVAVTWRVKGWPARILQHEVDHLDGTLYIDRMNPRSFSSPELVQQRFTGLSVAEIEAVLRVED